MLKPTGLVPLACLPDVGVSADKLDLMLVKLSKPGVDWQGGRVSGTVYHGDGILDLLTNAYRLFAVTNPLHPDVFPGVRHMEADICSILLRMFKAKDSAGASITSGGTESIMMTIKAHRDLFKSKGVTEPELIAAVSVHAAVDKSCHYLGVKLVHVPVDSDGRMSISAAKACINSNTIMIFGSAPSFPHGALDDLPALSKLAVEHKIGMHIDACLGGFLLPFMELAGFPLPHACDFTLPGVTSISCDTHKYGFSPKGSSGIMYHSKELRSYQYFVATDWTGGVYASPTLAGSRSGAVIAGTWTSMMHFGVNGYTSTTSQIIRATRKLRDEIRLIPGITVIGSALISVVAFYSTDKRASTYEIADLLGARGWLLNILQFPASIHMATTLPSVSAIDELVRDIKEVISILLGRKGAGGDSTGGSAKIYGTAASVSDRSIIRDVTRGFLDGLTIQDFEAECDDE